jgi:hypothetical protein
MEDRSSVITLVIDMIYFVWNKHFIRLSSDDLSDEPVQN